mgnify:CR=1 FL=1
MDKRKCAELFLMEDEEDVALYPKKRSKRNHIFESVWEYDSSVYGSYVNKSVYCLVSVDSCWGNTHLIVSSGACAFSTSVLSSLSESFLKISLLSSQYLLNTCNT